MPTIKDKLKAEERNERTVRLWPEGTFFKAYERSAYLFVMQVRNYEVRRRYVQAVGQDVVSIGFPQTVLTSLGLQHTSATDGSVEIRLDTPLDEQQYLLWRESIHTTPGPTPDPSPERGGELPVSKVEARDSPVIKRLRVFNLATATPLDCMLLVHELQNMIK